MDLTLLIAAVLSALAFSGITKLGGSSWKKTIWTAGLAFAGCYLLSDLIEYCSLPTYVGILGGYGWLITTDIITSVIAVALVLGVSSFFAMRRQAKEERARQNRSYEDRRSSGRDDGTPAAAKDNGSLMGFGLAGGMLVAMFAFYLLTLAYYNWGKENIAYYANNFANIEAAAPTDTLPPSNPDDFWYVPIDQAFAKAKQALNNDARLATIFQIKREHMVPQAVRNHNYYVAPLEYQDWHSQYGILGAAYAPKSPGYVMVDAEDPNAVGQLKVGPEYEMTYFPDASFDQNLERHVYEAGYKDGMLDDPTIEIDDDLHPHFTISFNQYRRVVYGEAIEKVLIVDAQTGKIDPYKPGEQPVWVDRVMSERLIKQYVGDWLRFGWKKDALETYSILFGGKSDQFAIQDEDLVYNRADRPTAMITVTSNDSTNDAIVAVIAYDTYRNHGVIYEGLKGVQPASHAIDAFKAKMPANARNWQVTNVHLYQIIGHLTWSCVYISGDTGSIVGVGFVDATPGKTQAANAVYGADKRTALSEYSRRLMQEQTGNDSELAGGQAHYLSVHGLVFRIGHYDLSGNTQFNFTIISDGTPKGLLPQTFLADPQAIPFAQFVREGDTVTMEYEVVPESDQLLVRSVAVDALKGLSAPKAKALAATAVAVPAPAKP